MSLLVLMAGCSQITAETQQQVAFVDLETQQLVLGVSREELLQSGQTSGQLALAGFSKSEQCWYPLPERDGHAGTANPLQIAAEDYGTTLELITPTPEQVSLPVKFPKTRRR